MTTRAEVRRIALENAVVKRADFQLGPISLELAGGSRVALVGPNGAGKTTLLRVMSGSIDELHGRCTIEGIDSRQLSIEARRRVGVLPETLRAYGWMSVKEYLALVAAFHPAWDDAYALAMLERLALSPKARVGSLSKGMKVKLSFVAAEAFRPSVLLLDEPTSGLDPVMRREVMDVVAAAAAEIPDRLVVFSTHLLEDVEWLASRVIVISRGRVVRDTSLEELRAAARRDTVSLSAVLLSIMERVGESV
jgi:ABC-2 type transport system ATP-binding protein